MKPLSVMVEEAALEAQIDLGDTADLNKIRQAIKRAYHSLWQKYLWREIIVLDEPITINADSDVLVVPHKIGNILAITNRNIGAVLSARSTRVFQLEHIATESVKGSPLNYTRMGTRGVESQPASAGVLTLVSDSSADSMDVRISCIDSNGVRRSELVTMNGTNSVDSTISTNEIIDISKSTLSTGIITVSDSDTNVLTRIAPYDYCNKYDLLQLAIPADAAYTVYLCGKLRFQNLVNNEDVCRFDCCEALILFGIAAIWKDRKSDDKANRIMAEANALISNLVAEKFVQDETIPEAMPHKDTLKHDYPVLSGTI